MSNGSNTPFRRERNLSRRNFARASSSSFSSSTSRSTSTSSSRYLTADSSSSFETTIFAYSPESPQTSSSFTFPSKESSSQVENVDQQQQDQKIKEESIEESSTAASVRELRQRFESLLPIDQILFKTGKFLSVSQLSLENSVKDDRMVQVIPKNSLPASQNEENDFSDFDDDDDDGANTVNDVDDDDRNVRNVTDPVISSVTIPQITIEDYRNVEHIRLSKMEGDQESNVANNDIGSITNVRHDFPRNFRSTHRPKTEIIAATNRPVIGKYHSYHHKGKYDANVTVTTDETTTENQVDEEEIIYRDKCEQFIHPILEELIKTEETYVENLWNGIENYGNIFNRKDIPMGLRGKKFVLLGNIEQIAEFHRDEFLPMLLRNRGDLKRLFDEFTVFIDENCFYGYVIFTMNKMKSLKLCEIYKHYFKQIQNEVNDKLGINSFLVQPIQRMARYPLLLQQFITTLFKNRDYVFKPIIESCCRLEKRLRNLLITTNESEIINDIVECNEFNVFYQGKFRKVSEFYVFDHTAKRGYRSNVFIFDKCVVYTEIRDKNLVFRGCYPCEKIGIHAKTKCFTLFYQKRKIQECDFMGDAALVEVWLEMIKDMISSFVKEERLKLKEKYSRDYDQVHLRRPQSLSQFRNSNRFSSDSGIGNMWSLPKPEPENRSEGENTNRTTWYTAS